MIDFTVRREGLGFHLNKSYALPQGTEGTTTTTQTNGSTTNGTGTNTNNSSTTQTVTVGGSDDNTVGYGFDGPITQDLSSTLTMVAISVIASRLFLYGKVTYDIILAAGAGSAFIYGDMSATNDLKDAKNKIEFEVKRNGNGDITDEQRQYIVRLITMYRSSLQAAERKKQMQTAAGVLFLLAAATAVYFSTAETTAAATCFSSIANMAIDEKSKFSCSCSLANLGCSAMAAAYATKESTPTISCSLELPIHTSGISSYSGTRAAPSPTCVALSQINSLRSILQAKQVTLPLTCSYASLLLPPCGLIIPTPEIMISSCTAMFGLHLGYESGCLSPTILIATTAAAVALTGITASTIVTALVSLSTPLSETVDTALFMPMRRAIMWGVLAGLTTLAANATDNVINQINLDISKLEALLGTVNELNHGNNVYKPVTPTAPRPTLPNFKAIGIVGKDDAIATDFTTSGIKLPCITNTTPNSNSGCPSFSDALDKSAAGLDMSEFNAAFGEDIKNAKTFIDGLNDKGKVTNGTLAAGGRLGANLKAINSKLASMRANLQKSLNDSNANINLSDETKKFRDGIGKAFNDTIIANKFNQASLSKAYGSGGFVSDANSTNGVSPSKMSAEDLKKAALDKEALAKLAAMNAAALKAAQDAANAMKGKKFDMSIKNEEPEMPMSAIEPPKMDENNKPVEITNDKSQSIFEVISNRYLKSAYPRLFKKIE